MLAITLSKDPYERRLWDGPYSVLAKTTSQGITTLPTPNLALKMDDADTYIQPVIILGCHIVGDLFSSLPLPILFTFILLPRVGDETKRNNSGICRLT